MVSADEQLALRYFHQKLETAKERVSERIGASREQVIERLAASIVWNTNDTGQTEMRLASGDAGRDDALAYLQMLVDVVEAKATFSKWKALLKQYERHKSTYEQHVSMDLFSSRLLTEPRDAPNYWRCVYELVYRTMCATGILSKKWEPRDRSTQRFVGLTPMERRYVLEWEGGSQPDGPEPFCTVRNVQRITNHTPDDKYIMRTSSRMHNLQVLFAHMSASYNVPYIRHVSAAEQGHVQDSKCYQCSHDHVLAGTLLAHTREQIVCVLRDLQTIRITPTSIHGRFDVHSLVPPDHSVYRELFGVRSHTGAFTYIEDTKASWNGYVYYRIRCYDHDPRGRERVGCKVSYNHRMCDVEHFERAGDAHQSPHSAAYFVVVKSSDRSFVERETTTLVLFQSAQELTCVNDILRSVSYDEGTPKADVHRYAVALDCMDVSYVDLLRTIRTHPTFKDVLYVQEGDSTPDELVVHVNFKYRARGIGQDRHESLLPVAYFQFSKQQTHITMHIDVRVMFLFDVCITLMLQCINHTPRQPPYTEPATEGGDLLHLPTAAIERVYMQYADDMAFNSNHIGNIKTNKRFPILLSPAQTLACMREHKRHFFMKYPLRRDAARMQTEQMSARIQSALHGGMFFTTSATHGQATSATHGQDTMPTVSDYSFGSRIIYDTTLVPTTIQTSNKKPHFLARTGFPKDGIAPNECRYLLFSYYSLCVALHFRRTHAVASAPASMSQSAPASPDDDVGRDCATYITCILHPFLSQSTGDVPTLPPYTPKQLRIMRAKHLEYTPGMTTRTLCRTYREYVYDAESDVGVEIRLPDVDLDESQLDEGLGLLDELVSKWESLSHAHKVTRVRDSVVTDKILIRHLPVRLFTPIADADVLFGVTTRIKTLQASVFSAEAGRYLRALEWRRSASSVADAPNTLLIHVDAAGHATLPETFPETLPESLAYDPSPAMQAIVDASDGAPAVRILHDSTYYDTWPTTTMRLGVCAELGNMSLFTCTFYCAHSTWPSAVEVDDFKSRFPWFETTHLTTHRVAALQEMFACNLLLLPYDVLQSALRCTPATTATLLHTFLHVDASVEQVAMRRTFVIADVDHFYEPVLWVQHATGGADAGAKMTADWTRRFGSAFFERFLTSTTRAYTAPFERSCVESRVQSDRACMHRHAPAYVVSTASPRLYLLGGDVYRFRSQHLNEVGNVRSILAQSSDGVECLLIPVEPIAPFAIPNATHAAVSTLRNATRLESPRLEAYGTDAACVPLQVMRVDYPGASTDAAPQSLHVRYRTMFDRMFELCLLKGAYLADRGLADPRRISVDGSIVADKPSVDHASAALEHYATHVTDDAFNALLGRLNDTERVSSSVWTTMDPILVMHCMEDATGRLCVTPDLASSLTKRMNVTKLASGPVDAKSHRLNINGDWNAVHAVEYARQTWFYLHTFPDSQLAPTDNNGWQPAPTTGFPVAPTHTHVQHSTPHLLKAHTQLSFFEHPFVYKPEDSRQLWCIYTFHDEDDAHAWMQRTGLVTTPFVEHQAGARLSETLAHGVPWRWIPDGDIMPFVVLGFPIDSDEMELIMCGRPIVVHETRDASDDPQPHPDANNSSRPCKSAHKHWLSMLQCFPSDLRTSDDPDDISDTDADSLDGELVEPEEPDEGPPNEAPLEPTAPSTAHVAHTAHVSHTAHVAHAEPSVSELFDAFIATSLARRYYGQCWAWSYRSYEQTMAHPSDQADETPLVLSHVDSDVMDVPLEYEPSHQAMLDREDPTDEPAIMQPMSADEPYDASQVQPDQAQGMLIAPPEIPAQAQQAQAQPEQAQSDRAQGMIIETPEIHDDSSQAQPAQPAQAQAQPDQAQGMIIETPEIHDDSSQAQPAQPAQAKPAPAKPAPAKPAPAKPAPAKPAPASGKCRKLKKAPCLEQSGCKWKTGVGCVQAPADATASSSQNHERPPEEPTIVVPPDPPQGMIIAPSGMLPDASQSNPAPAKPAPASGKCRKLKKAPCLEQSGCEWKTGVGCVQAPADATASSSHNHERPPEEPTIVVPPDPPQGMIIAPSGMPPDASQSNPAPAKPAPAKPAPAKPAPASGKCRKLKKAPCLEQSGCEWKTGVGCVQAPVDATASSSHNHERPPEEPTIVVPPDPQQVAPSMPPDASQSKPAQAKPAKANPEQAKPAKAKPEQSKPAKAKPAKANPEQAKPAKAKPEQSKPAQANPEQSENEQTNSK
jgi:hypothetical protein